MGEHRLNADVPSKHPGPPSATARTQSVTLSEVANLLGGLRALPGAPRKVRVLYTHFSLLTMMRLRLY